MNQETAVRARDLRLQISGSEFDLEYEGRPTRIKTGLIGRHNIYNILASAAFAFTQNVDPEDIQTALNNFPGVRGRLERVEEVQDRFVFVDYAHTPDALENVLAARILSKPADCSFWLRRRRDRLKRPLMGQTAEKYADRIVITSDNPRGEEPQDIAREITCGLRIRNIRLFWIAQRGHSLCPGEFSFRGRLFLLPARGMRIIRYLRIEKYILTMSGGEGMCG